MVRHPGILHPATPACTSRLPAFPSRPAAFRSGLKVGNAARHLLTLTKQTPLCYPRSMKFGVLVFPGSNCDHDTYNVIGEIAHQPVTFLWHDSRRPAGLRRRPGSRRLCLRRLPAHRRHCALLARDAGACKRFAAGGGLVLGICNGFQILCEAGLLPGALMRNAGLKYICKQVHLRTETADTPFTNPLNKGQVLQIPIGHMEGNYFCDARGAAPRSKRDDRIAFRYATPAGEITPRSQSQRLARQHCRHPERRPKRAGHDAPPRPLQRSAARLRRWLRDLRVHDWALSGVPADGRADSMIDIHHHLLSGARRWRPHSGYLAGHGGDGDCRRHHAHRCTPHASDRYFFDPELNAALFAELRMP